MTSKVDGDGEPESWKRALGHRVRTLRDERKRTRQKIADESGLSLRFLADVEAGRANPSLGSLHALADALGVEVVELLHQDNTRPLALLGLRGAGKSSIGKRVARILGWPFVEVDAEIEQEAGMSLASVFAMHGESYYRMLEERVLRRLLASKSPIVLATGGGVVTHEESWRLLKTHALTVWLKATPQEHWDRVVAQGDARPMQARSRARQELETLYTTRAPLYAASELVVDTSALDLAESSKRIAQHAR